MNYKKAGVDIEKGDEFAKSIASIASVTNNSGVVKGIGSFGALFSLKNFGHYEDPIIVSSTDGVGTKLKLAFQLNQHHTVGIDLVAMCVNDILTCGATPLFFLDYFATGKLEKGIGMKVMEGIVTGCLKAGCALVGGETAEMPGMYKQSEYDLAGFVVGVVERKNIIDGSTIEPGDILVGLESDGLHSNGYSLVRKIFENNNLEEVFYDPKRKCQLGNIPLGHLLLQPTKIYVNLIRYLKDKVNIKGMAHITGGGITGNVPRILPQGLKVVYNTWDIPQLFKTIQSYGKITTKEMFKTFNMGIGYVIVVNSKDVKKVIEMLRVPFGCGAYEIGSIQSK